MNAGTTDSLAAMEPGAVPFSVLVHHRLVEHAEDHSLFSGAYEDFLKAVLEFAEIVPLADIRRRRADRIRLGLRMDVDRDPYSALFTAGIEHHCGVPSTYFFLPTAEYYGIWEGGRLRRNSGIFDEMLYLQDRLRREIGYHDDGIKLFVDHGLAPDVSLSQELAYWRDRGLRPRGICSHNSAYVYGVGSFEIWEGQSIEGRTSAQVKGRTLPLGTLPLRRFGLEYDANFITEVRWMQEPLAMHGRVWGRAEELSRDVDALFFLGYGGRCTVHTGRRGEMIAADVPLSDMPRLIREKGKGQRWLFMGHPNYFGRVPAGAVGRDRFAEWVAQGGSRSRNGEEKRSRMWPVHVALTSTVPMINAPFAIGKAWFGDRFLRNPETIRNRLRYYSRKHREGVYWENARPGVHFMAPYMERAFNLILALEPDLQACSLLDLAGGCGNLGLALSLFGLKRYVLNDVHPSRMAWARRLFTDYGFQLNTAPGDLRALDLAETFRTVTLLGWENFDVSYEEAIAAARRAQGTAGWFLLTYQDFDEYVLGRWEEEYREWHGVQPKTEDGRYTISRRKLVELLRTHRYELMSLDYANHEQSARGYYPQYVVCAKAV